MAACGFRQIRVSPARKSTLLSPARPRIFKRPLTTSIRWRNTGLSRSKYVSGEAFNILGRGLRLQVTQAAKDSISADGVYIHLGVRDLHDIERKRRVVNRFLGQQCRTVFGDVMDALYPSFQKYGVQKPSLRIRDMETRWGSCLAKKGIITLNKRLLEAPRHCIEYVVMHELCHLVHPNHSRQFYAFLTMLMPDWKERKQYLDKTAAYWL